MFRFNYMMLPVMTALSVLFLSGLTCVRRCWAGWGFG